MSLKILWLYSVKKSDNGKDLYNGYGVAEKKDTVTFSLSMPTTISVHSPLLASSNKFICDSLQAIFHTYFDTHPR